VFLRGHVVAALRAAGGSSANVSKKRRYSKRLAVAAFTQPGGTKRRFTE